MNVKILLFLLMNLSFFGYVGYIIKKYGVRKSISDSYYYLPKNKKFIFSLIMWCFSLPAIILGVEYSGLAFLAGGAIAFVGASPAFKDFELEHKVHVISALIGVFSSQLMILLNPFNLWFLNIIFILLCGLVMIIPNLKKNFTWWCEIIAFTSISIAYLLKIILNG